MSRCGYRECELNPELEGAEDPVSFTLLPAHLGPEEAAHILEEEGRQRASRIQYEAAAGDGACFKPFRFPCKMSEAFQLPWGDIDIVSDEQLEMFYQGCGLRKLPRRACGAVRYVDYHYMTPNRQKIISRGRHCLMIKISEGSGRQLKRKALAYYLPATEVLERYSTAAQAEKYHCDRANLYMCQMVETYDMNTTMPIMFEYGERPHVIAAGCPYHFTVRSLPERLIDSSKCVEALAGRKPDEAGAEAKKADKRRRKRHNKKTKERERSEAANAEAAKLQGEERNTDAKALESQRKHHLVQPNAALRDSNFMQGLLSQMRDKTSDGGARTARKVSPVFDNSDSCSEDSDE
eukprot:TRINITY_DN91785_c0_g1_i1.p1 TRINITY_DN91785_c0_g1~~TRINITY_DN91785_c0_g1_i1.p1  ORF type:complete len:350 (+),score=50.10 TRINITY_DN91785_c0_g1_i1:104-1153(+)